MDQKTFEITREEIAETYSQMTGSVSMTCRFVTDLVGGLPADDEALMAFIENHLKLTGEQANEAFARIRKEEVTRNVTPETGEVHEEEVYGVNVFRRTSHGIWLGDWMVKACIKAAASRAGLFVSNRGLKGDIAEGGCVRATGLSRKEKDHPERIYLYHEETGESPVTKFEQFMGRVQTPQGAKSIVHHSEVLKAGAAAWFDIEVRFLPGHIDQEDLKKILALMGNIGLGSAKALERGKYELVRVIGHGVVPHLVKPSKSEKKEKPKKEDKPQKQEETPAIDYTQA